MLRVSKKRFFYSLIITFVVIFALLFVFNFSKITFYFKYASSNNLSIGIKSFSFKIENQSIVDAKSIESNETVFELIKSKEKKKMVVFLRMNEFRIKPGSYTLKYSDKFENMVDKLCFDDK